jgi:hypothetical protein
MQRIQYVKLARIREREQMTERPLNRHGKRVVQAATAAVAAATAVRMGYRPVLIADTPR